MSETEADILDDYEALGFVVGALAALADMVANVSGKPVPEPSAVDPLPMLEICLEAKLIAGVGLRSWDWPSAEFVWPEDEKKVA
ncbi:Uncharacterised protein [Mycobacteroides abscessus subsp. bolletii]|uniref:hypothetical protein n=1 Tax=Mycobacteroides abscessus TaxID=36809 RepID=UPI0009A6F1A8|nr:hypothetical protein [Mycobacteroides abscessus]SLF32692.1 Uncharacterised protein [Mycobacteroides abscessus subsp. bolletii]